MDVEETQRETEREKENGRRVENSVTSDFRQQFEVNQGLNCVIFAARLFSIVAIIYLAYLRVCVDVS